MSTRYAPPRYHFYFGLIVALVTIIILGIMESRSTNASNPTPAPSSAPHHLIHTHGASSASSVPAEQPSTDTDTAVAEREHHIEQERNHALAMNTRRTGPAFGINTEEQFDAWIDVNEAEWYEADDELRDCAEHTYLNGWSWTPGAAIDSCLTIFEFDEGD